MMKQTRDEIIRVFAQHVSPGKVDLYNKYNTLIVPDKRRGSFIYDMDGRRYINCHSNGGVFNLGHRNPQIIRAVTSALKKYDISNHHLVSGPRAELAEMLSETLPPGLDQVVYGVGGGEAVDLAIKLARGVTGRREIISAKGGFHGHTGLALAAGDRKYRDKFNPMAPGFRQIRFNSIEALEKVLSGKTAAVLLETIPATLGIAVPGKDYLKKIKQLCSKNGTLLILDEVQTGFGRTGRLWGFENFNLRPDIIILGKGMSGGIYPISATIYQKKYSWFFREDPFVHISTCGGSEIGCHAAMEVLKISREKAFLDNVNSMSSLLINEIRDLSDQFPSPGLKIRGLGLMLGLEFKDELTALIMLKLLFDNGIYVVYSGNYARVLQFLPSLLLKESEAVLILKGIKKSLKQISGR